MGRTVSFSFDTEEDKIAFIEYAKHKGMTLSGLAKMAIYQYRAKYPIRERKTIPRIDSLPMAGEMFIPYSPTETRLSGEGSQP